MPKIRSVLLTGLVGLYIVIAILFAFSSDSLTGIAGATGNVISEIPYGPDLTTSSEMLIIPGLLLLLSVAVVVVYLKSD